VAGAERVGSSSRQSLLRGAGSIETDYLNGEIVLLGRLHGVPTPVNAGLCRLGRLLLSGQRPAGSLGSAEIESIVSG
jgi:2-dehydropantoate 2-reductase